MGVDVELSPSDSGIHPELTMCQRVLPLHVQDKYPDMRCVAAEAAGFTARKAPTNSTPRSRTLEPGWPGRGNSGSSDPYLFVESFRRFVLSMVCGAADLNLHRFVRWFLVIPLVSLRPYRA